MMTNCSQDCSHVFSFIMASSCNNGQLNLPEKFCSEIGEKIPVNVYLRVRNCDAWSGLYSHENYCINDVGRMMAFYDVKPYYVILLEYKGHGRFFVEIFNNHIIEIDYPLRPICTKEQQSIGYVSRSEERQYVPIELAKMASIFYYNALNKSTVTCNVVIRNDHLQHSNMIQVLSEDNLLKLRLHSDMRWIQLSVDKFKWIVKLKWQDGQLFFDQGWTQFVKTLNLRVDDILVLVCTGHAQKFAVTIFENRHISDNQKDNKVIGKGKSNYKWFKIVSHDMLETGDIQLQPDFMKVYGGSLSKKLYLVIADGNEYRIGFSRENSLLYGLKELFTDYCISDGTYIFFSYITSSDLSVSFYSESGVNYLNHWSKEHYVRNNGKSLVPGNITSSDTREQLSCVERISCKSHTIFEEIESYVICQHWKTSFDKRNLLLPVEFVSKFGKNLAKKVILSSGGGPECICRYNEETKTIEMPADAHFFSGFDPYNVLVLQYIGGRKFILRIFNCYCIEVEYASFNEHTQRKRMEPASNMMSKSYLKSSFDVVEEKRKFAFSFNSCRSLDNIFELKIEKKHLNTSGMNKICLKDIIGNLEINEKLPFVHFGFSSKRWTVALTFDNGKVCVGQGWNAFSVAAGLKEGDICIFQLTNKKNDIQVAVSDNEYISNWNSYQDDVNKQVTVRFVKIIDEISILQGKIFLPVVFTKKYAGNLSNKLQLWLADRKICIVPFCSNKKCIYGIETLFQDYEVVANSTFLFHYLGKSTFYLTMFSPAGSDLLENFERKLLLKDVVITDINLDIRKQKRDASSQTVDNIDTTLPDIVNHFLVTLKKSHLDGHSHGAYCPADLNLFQGKQYNDKKVVITYKRKQWEIRVNPVGKRFRFGSGWSKFMNDNNFAIGICLKFECSDSRRACFSVSVVS